MEKKLLEVKLNLIISFLIAMVVLLGTSIDFVFATDESNKKDIGENNIVIEENKDIIDKSPTQDFIPLQPKIKLSLDEAIKIMTTVGTNAKSAELKMKRDFAVQEEFSEKYDKIKKAMDNKDKAQNAINYLQGLGLTEQKAEAKVLGSGNTMMDLADYVQSAGATSNNKELAKTGRDFTKKNTTNNYKAEMNKIIQDTVALYDGVLLTQENYKIAKDSLKAQQENLKNIELQYKVGILSKLDVLKSKSAVEKAEMEVLKAENKMKETKMKFNYLLGYNVMQEVEFKDRLKKDDKEIENINEAIGSAILNRNEIKASDIAVTMNKIKFNDCIDYPKSSSTYLKAQNDVLVAEKNSLDARSKIEIDIRSKKNQLEEKRLALKSADALVKYAEEAVRLMKLTHQEGISTTQELLDAEVKLYKVNLNRAKAISEYNKALRAYNDAQGVGTFIMPFEVTQ